MWVGGKEKKKALLSSFILGLYLVVYFICLHVFMLVWILYFIWLVGYFCCSLRTEWFCDSELCLLVCSFVCHFFLCFLCVCVCVSWGFCACCLPAFSLVHFCISSLITFEKDYQSSWIIRQYWCNLQKCDRPLSIPLLVSTLGKEMISCWSRMKLFSPLTIICFNIFQKRRRTTAKTCCSGASESVFQQTVWQLIMLRFGCWHPDGPRLYFLRPCQKLLVRKQRRKGKRKEVLYTASSCHAEVGICTLGIAIIYVTCDVAWQAKQQATPCYLCGAARYKVELPTVVDLITR